MLAKNDFQNLSMLENLNTPGLNAVKLIEDKVLIPLKRLDPSTSTSDLKKIFGKKLKKILERVSPDLEPLSLRFWNRPLEDPVITEEVLAALVLKFLSGMCNSVQLEEILYCFQFSRFEELADILKRIIASKELKSFNISGFILFTDFKYIRTLGSEITFWRISVASEIKNFDDYFDDFMKFLSNNSLFTEHMKNICHFDENTFNLLLNFALRNIILMHKQVLELYGADGFTSYDRKIYLKFFKTGYPVMDRAAIFYVLLHELCHYFRRISCITWEDSRNCSTPEKIIDNIPINEAGNIFEIEFFGKRHKFLNEKACDFFLSSTETLSRKDYSKKFASINKIRGNVYVPLMRGICLSNKGVVELSGCLISRYRGYS
ncbi:hypothetical protein SteCoe_24662 [Stentor coeruleus]|uniref:Uncharacterized protein n=1 Tax=Stentor coeruleus TaxID=5963 RepID=A0A1R2BGZ8_9CILI|nr:hypothetical protein SteCoe_24662 [Stentor coeruleus]